MGCASHRPSRCGGHRWCSATRPARPRTCTGLLPGQSIAALFHAEGDPRMLAALVANKVTAYSYEFLTEQDRSPLTQAGGHIAGVQAVLAGAQALQTPHGRGVLLAAVPDAPAAQVVVIGSGTVGSAAAAFAARLGAQVTVLAHTEASARRYQDDAPLDVHVEVNTEQVRRAWLSRADLVIGAILISTYDTPAMITEVELAEMRDGAVIVDATCGYGLGYLPTAGPVQRPGDPPRQVAGVLHVKLDALPALVPVTTTAAYSARAANYLLRLAHVVFDGVTDEAIESACIARTGELVHPVCLLHAGFYGMGA